MKIKIEYGDISKYDKRVDVIINSWNRNFMPYKFSATRGVSKDIKERAGAEPFNELKKKGALSIGEAVLTSPGNLECKGIIHVAGVGFLHSSSEHAIRLSIKNAMSIVIVKKFKSVAIPLIGCGENKFPPEKCVKIISEELSKWNLNIDAIIVIHRE